MLLFGFRNYSRQTRELKKKAPTEAGAFSIKSTNSKDSLAIHYISLTDQGSGCLPTSTGSNGNFLRSTGAV